MPPQNRVGRGDRGDLTEPGAPDPLSANRQAVTFVIGQPKAPSAQLASKDSILLDQIDEAVLLPTIQPTRSERREEPAGKERQPRRESTSTPDANRPPFG